MISNLGHSLTHIQNGPIFRHITWNGVEFIISLNSWEYSPIPDFQNEKHRPPPNSTPAFLSSTRTEANTLKSLELKKCQGQVFSEPRSDQPSPPVLPGHKTTASSLRFSANRRDGSRPKRNNRLRTQHPINDCLMMQQSIDLFKIQAQVYYLFRHFRECFRVSNFVDEFGMSLKFQVWCMGKCLGLLGIR